MRTLQPRFALILLFMLSIVVVPATVTLGASDRAVAATTEDIRQDSNGDLVFQLSKDRVGNDSTVTVKISTPDDEASLGKIASSTTNGGSYQYRIPASDLPEFSLDQATVRVTDETGGNTTVYLNESIDLQYLRLGGRAYFQDGTLVIPAEETVGLGESVSVSTMKQSELLSLAVENGTVRLSHADLVPLLTPPTSLSLTSGGSDLTLVGKTTVNLRKAARDDTQATRASNGLVLKSPLLVANQSYSVKVTTKKPQGQYVATKSTGSNSGKLVIANEYLTGAEHLKVIVTIDGVSVLTTKVEQLKTISGSVDQTGRSIAIKSGLPDSNVSVALLSTRDRVYVLKEVYVSETTIRLTDLPEKQVLKKNGTYQLGLEFDEYGPAVVAIESGNGKLSSLIQADGDQNNTTAGGKQTGLLPVIGVVVSLMLLVLYLLISRKSNTVESRDLRVQIVDELTKEPIRDQVLVTAKTEQSESVHQEVISGGEGNLELPMKTMKIRAQYNDQKTARKVSSDIDRVKLILPAFSHQLQVVDESEEPVKGANVQATYDGGSVSAATDKQGKVSLQFPANAANIEITAERDRFEPDQYNVDELDELPTKMQIVGKTGELRLETRIDGDVSDAVNVSSVTGDDKIRNRLTGRDITRQRSSITLPIGEYKLVGTVPIDTFGEVRQKVSIQEDKTTEVTLDVPFQFDLSSGQREELEALRADASDLIPSSRLDTAIHRYYASVAEQLADTVERIPKAGKYFAETEIDPDPVVNSILEAGRGAISSIDNAMNTKHNVDLFSACSDMREANVEWTDGYDLKTFFDLAYTDRVGQRAELKSCLSETKSELEKYRGEVAVISPAQDAIDELEQYIGDVRESDEIRNAGFVFVVIGFIDAVAAIFDQPRLLDRLNRTVY